MINVAVVENNAEQVERFISHIKRYSAESGENCGVAAFGNDKEIKEISLADNDKAIDELKIQPLSSLVHQKFGRNFHYSSPFLC